MERRGVCSSLHISGPSPPSKAVKVETQGRNIEAGADAETVEGAAHWLALHVYSACFLITPRTTALSKSCTTDVVPLKKIINKKIHTSLSQGPV